MAGISAVTWTPSVAYREYVALLTQVGTDHPTAIVLANSIGDVVWTRVAAGNYVGTLAGAFPSGRTVVLTPTILTDPIDTGYSGWARRFNDDYIEILTYADPGLTNADGRLNLTPIVFRVY